MSNNGPTMGDTLIGLLCLRGLLRLVLNPVGCFLLMVAFSIYCIDQGGMRFSWEFQGKPHTLIVIPAKADR